MADQDKLASLHAQFRQFEEHVTRDSAHRKQHDLDRLDGIRDAMEVLEKALNAEIRRRVEANQGIELMFETQLGTVQADIENLFARKVAELEALVLNLTDRMRGVEEEMKGKREEHVEEVAERQCKVRSDVERLQKAFEKERTERMAREEALARKLADYETATLARVDQERVLRARKYTELQSDLDIAQNERAANDARFEDFMLQELAAVKNGLLEEASSREDADNDIVRALNEYTRALQEGLRAFNRG